MICKNYLQLVDEGTSELFLAELLHIVMHDDDNFNKATMFINKAKSNGLLKNVKFYPENDTDIISSENLIP
jgi:hypothetical protein